MPKDVDRHEPSPQSLSKAEIVNRLVGLSREHDAEDIEYWRNATDVIRGRTLHQLLMMVHAIGQYPEKNSEFPGFPSRIKHPQ